MEKQEEFHLGLCLVVANTSGAPKATTEDLIHFRVGGKLFCNREVTDTPKGAGKASLTEPPLHR